MFTPEKPAKPAAICQPTCLACQIPTALSTCQRNELVQNLVVFHAVGELAAQLPLT